MIKLCKDLSPKSIEYTPKLTTWFVYCVYTNICIFCLSLWTSLVRPTMYMRHELLLLQSFSKKQPIRNAQTFSSLFAACCTNVVASSSSSSSSLSHDTYIFCTTHHITLTHITNILLSCRSCPSLHFRILVVLFFSSSYSFSHKPCKIYAQACFFCH